MKYIKLAFQYMFNNHFWKLAIMVLIPCVGVCFFSSFESTAKMILSFPTMTEYTFRSVYLQSSELNSPDWWLKLLVLFVALIVLSVIFSIYIGTMQRHMRTGRFAVTNVWKRINEHFLPTIITIAFVFVSLYIYGLLIDTTVVLWWAITKNWIATYVLTIIFMVVLFLLLACIFNLLSFVLPHMVVTGENLGDSIGFSIRTTKQVFRPLFVSVAFPIGILMALQFPFALINIRAVHIVLDALTLFFICTYYPVLVFVAYYDCNEKDREDLLPVNRM